MSYPSPDPNLYHPLILMFGSAVSYFKGMKKARDAGARTENHHIYPISYGGEDCRENIAELLTADHTNVHDVINDDHKTYKKYRRKQSILENGNYIPTEKAINHMSEAQRRLLERTKDLPVGLQEIYQAKTYEVMVKEAERFNKLTGDNYIPEIGSILENHEVYTRAKQEIRKVLISKLY